MDSVKAAVCRQPGAGFRVEDLAVDDPRPDEVLVRFTAAGLCHTDLEVAAGRMPTPFPVIAGHEGAGVVEDVGSAVTGFRRGDRVVASFSFCGTCRNCLNGRPAYCPQHFPLNFGARRADGSAGLRDAAGEPVHDHFFGSPPSPATGCAGPAAGTPGGTGVATGRFLGAGDVVSVAVGTIGTLTNTIAPPCSGTAREAAG